MSATTFSSRSIEGVGPLQLLGEDQVVRRPAEEVAHPDPFGELLAVERRGLGASGRPCSGPTPWS